MGRLIATRKAGTCITGTRTIQKRRLGNARKPTAPGRGTMTIALRLVADLKARTGKPIVVEAQTLALRRCDLGQAQEGSRLGDQHRIRAEVEMRLHQRKGCQSME